MSQTKVQLIKDGALAEDSIVHDGDTNTKIRFPAADTITAETGGSERVRITTDGRVGVGTAPDSGIQLHVQKSGEANIILEGDVNGQGGFLMLKNNSDNANTTMSIQNLDAGGQGTSDITFQNVSNANNEGLMRFSTRPSGGAMTERMRILSDGAVVVNATARPVVGTEFLGVQGGSASNAVGIGAACSHQDGIPFFAGNSSGTSGQRLMRFSAGSGGDTRGTITFNGSVLVYGGSSDYRLKKNVTSLTNGITKLKQLKPITFDWIKETDNNNVMGFLAHEVQEVMPQVVTGEKDEVNSEGKPEYQEMDYGALTPLLTAALQEAITKIETLETRVAALEAA